MKLTRIRRIGRYRNTTTGQCVNIHKGQRVPRGDDFYFYVVMRKGRVLVPAHEINKTWQRIGP